MKIVLKEIELQFKLNNKQSLLQENAKFKPHLVNSKFNRVWGFVKRKEKERNGFKDREKYKERDRKKKRQRKERETIIQWKNEKEAWTEMKSKR